MATRKNFTRNELKAFLTLLKTELGVEYNTRDINTIDGCKKAMIEIIDDYAYKKFTSAYGIINSENIFLKTQIEELKKKTKNKKSWWEFWK